MQDIKTCPNCQQSKSLTDFYFSANRYHTWCKICEHERINRRNRERVEADPVGRRKELNNKRRYTVYGITEQEFQDKIALQNGLCLICQQPLPGSRHTHIDHNHKTKKIRGILCSHCNSILGLANDNPEILRIAATYLERDENAMPEVRINRLD